jgi:G3E family GTPase
VHTVAAELRRLSALPAVESLIVELPAAAALTPFVEAFAREGASDEELSELAELDAVVVAVDGPRFFEDYTGTDRLAARGLALAGDDRRHVAQVLAEQIEAADVLVVTKVERVGTAELALLEDMLRHMNLCATLQRHPRSGASPAGAAACWAVAAGGPSASGIASFVYHARRPFHPERLRQHLQREWPGVLRSRGVFWLATRMSEVGSWSQAGPVWEIARGGHWWASLPCSTWAGSPRLSAAIREHWQEPFGDRRQELRFVGWDMDQLALQRAFDACLLTEDELAQGPAEWARLHDPFASWSELIFRHPGGRASAALH